MDDGLASIPALLTIADRVKNIDPARVNFITVPTVPAANPNRLQLSEPAAGNLFGALRQSADLAGPAPAPSDAPPAGTPKPDYDKSLQPVLIANGTTVPGRSHDLTPILTEAGFTNLSRIEAQPADETTVYYGPDFEDVAADVAALFGLPASKVQADSSVYGVQLYLGVDFTSGTKPEVAAPTARDVVAQTAEDQKCQAVR